MYLYVYSIIYVKTIFDKKNIKIIISTYKFQIKMPDAKLETAEELHALFSDDEKLKGHFILVLYIIKQFI
jgi:hypothetical protein